MATEGKTRQLKAPEETCRNAAERQRKEAAADASERKLLPAENLFEQTLQPFSQKINQKTRKQKPPSKNRFEERDKSPQKHR
jgi:hypothetical protein